MENHIGQRVRFAGILAMLVVSAWCGVARAASAGDGFQAPTMESRSILKAIGLVTLCLLGVVLCVLKNARRSHQDE
jgi:hypothetical protein